MSVIEIENLTKRFNDKLVLDNISLDVRKGEIFGLIGPNGAGKSTLINILMGLVEKDSGSISVFDMDIERNHQKIKEKMALVPQNLALIKDLDAETNLEYFGAFYGLGGRLLKERIKDVLEIVGLTDRRKDKVKTYSGGMSRRLNLGAAIMHNPEILILDEPTVGVDPQSRNYIFEYLKKINRSLSTTIIYTSHYMEEIEALCDNIFILDEGKEIAFGNQNEIRNLVKENNSVEIIVDSREDESEKIKLSLGVDNLVKKGDEYRVSIVGNPSMEKIISNLHGNGIVLKGIRIVEPRLEEVFLNLTGKTLRD